MDKREIPAGEFKAQCLAILDEVAGTGREIVITKRGNPVAKVVPIDLSDDRHRITRLDLSGGREATMRCHQLRAGRSLTPPIAIAASRLEWNHRDPFDRVIVATAIVHRAPLVTKDDHIRRYQGVATIW